jgi:hypothetical protein
VTSDDPVPTIPPAEPAEIRRKLLFGLALILAMLSMYAGLFGWGPFVQYALASGATAAVLIALISGAFTRK